jgi:hypothetical protein
LKCKKNQMSLFTCFNYRWCKEVVTINGIHCYTKIPFVEGYEKPILHVANIYLGQMLPTTEFFFPVVNGTQLSDK